MQTNPAQRRTKKSGKAHAPGARCGKRNARFAEVQAERPRAEQVRLPLPLSRPPLRRPRATVQAEPAAQARHPGWAVPPARALSRSHKARPPHRDRHRAASLPYESHPLAPAARATLPTPRGPATAAPQLFLEHAHFTHNSEHPNCKCYLPSQPGSELRIPKILMRPFQGAVHFPQ